MESGFFCDTSVIHGFCHKSDSKIKKESCKFFLSEYPCEDNDYFVPEIVKEELIHQKNVLNRNAGKLTPYEDDISRTFQRCVDAFLRKIVIISTKDYGEPYSKSIEKLRIRLQSVIKIKKQNQINDIEIVAESIFWSILTDYESHNLLTTDNTDIANDSKKKKIIRIANECLKIQITLEIIYLIGYYKKNQKK